MAASKWLASEALGSGASCAGLVFLRQISHAHRRLLDGSAGYPLPACA